MDVNSSTTLLYILIVVLLIAAVVIFMYMNSKMSLLKEKWQGAKDMSSRLEIELQQERTLLTEAHSQKESLGQELAALEADHRNLRIRYDEHLNDTQKLQERFENLANKILDEKSKKMDLQHKKGLNEILEPLKEKIKTFEQKVDQTNKESITRHTSLKEQILNLKELNEKMTLETTNLTKALKGESKTLGNWGELILESILQKSGLEKGREYDVQNSYTNDEGRILRPDVIIHLPDQKKLVVDSKVSLKAYDQFISAATDDEQKVALKALSLSIQSHYKSLADKKYHDIYQIESPDFVLMFIPIDTAFAAALSVAPELYSDAFERNVVIVTSSTLLATLKTVETMWRNEKQQRYAVDIANEAGKMYDKFTGFVDELIGLGKRIDQTKDAYQESMKKLYHGKGDLISRAEKIKQLGAKANKNLPEALIDRANQTNEVIALKDPT